MLALCMYIVQPTQNAMLHLKLLSLKQYMSGPINIHSIQCCMCNINIEFEIRKSLTQKYCSTVTTTPIITPWNYDNLFHWNFTTILLVQKHKHEKLVIPLKKDIVKKVSYSYGSKGEGAHLPFWGCWEQRWMYHSDAWLVQSQTYSYLPSCWGLPMPMAGGTHFPFPRVGGWVGLSGWLPRRYTCGHLSRY